MSISRRFISELSRASWSEKRRLGLSFQSTVRATESVSVSVWKHFGIRNRICHEEHCGAFLWWESSYAPPNIRLRIVGMNLGAHPLYTTACTSTLQKPDLHCVPLCGIVACFHVLSATTSKTLRTVIKNKSTLTSWLCRACNLRILTTSHPTYRIRKLQN